MYKVLIVDDEPVACRHIEKIIRQNCPIFTVCDIARNGKEAVEKLQKEPADVIITDIRMPVMDGLALSAYVVDNQLHSRIIIVSGYSDFSYAQSAVRLGVKDYILKPVLPDELKNLLDKIQLELNADLYEDRKYLISRLYHGDNVSVSQLERCFPYSGYYMALIRKNGLPVFLADSNRLEIFSEKEEMVFLYGRDECEALYICPKELVCQEHFISSILTKYKEEPSSYYTLITTRTSIVAADIPAALRRIYQTLDSSIVLGKNQTLTFSIHTPLRHVVPKDDRERFSLFSQYCEQQNAGKAQEELHQILIACDKHEVPMIQLKKILHRACFLLERYHLYQPSVDWLEEQIIEEALLYSENIQQLIKYMDDFLFRSTPSVSFQKMDTVEYYEKIIRYLESHYREPITLQSACKILGISRTYLNTLLRKYNNESFTSCLTRIRIEHAKKIMKASGNTLLIKDVAEQVGFPDQFYFSRIFRSYTGISPSEYFSG